MRRMKVLAVAMTASVVLLLGPDLMYTSRDSNANVNIARTVVRIPWIVMDDVNSASEKYFTIAITVPPYTP